MRRPKHLTARPLILPDKVLRMRGDEQIVLTAGNAPSELSSGPPAQHP